MFARKLQLLVQNSIKRTVVIISDCRDDNARMRLELAAVRAIPGVDKVIFCGVKNDTEAAGCVVDALAQMDSRKPAVLLVNVAPRNIHSENGSPFGVVRHENALIFSTIEGYTLQLLAKLRGGVISCDVFDIEQAVSEFPGLSHFQREQIIGTQFRSLEFLPRVAREVILGTQVPFETQFKEMEHDTHRVWWVDNFGNCKTTIMPEDVGFRVENTIKIEFAGEEQTIPCCALINDVDEGKVGIKIGSSGIGSRRFLELFVRRGSAAELFGIKTGHLLFYRADRIQAIRPVKI